MPRAHRPLVSRPRRGLAIAFPAALAFAACSASTTAPALAPAPVERPDPARLAADVAWLAGDAREGRRAGTAGERAAADWLARRLAELGLESAGDGGFLQSFEVPLEPEDTGRSWVMRLPDLPAGRASDATPVQGEGFVEPLFCSAAGTADGPLDFRGYGLREERPGWNDYEIGSCEGAIVLVVDGLPPLPPVAAEAAARTGSSVHDKVMTAKRRGAIGVIVAQHPRDAGEPLRDFHDGSTSTSTVPALTVSVAVAERLLGGFREHVAALDAQARASGSRPAGGLASPGRVALSAGVRRGNGTATNVLGVVPGVDRERTLVVGAHFDHLGRGGSGSRARGVGAIHNGADDNASGTAAVLELARLLQRRPERPPCDVLVALWSGGERERLGSVRFLEAREPEHAILGYLNLDTVGRSDGRPLEVRGLATSEAFAELVAAAGAASGVALDTRAPARVSGASDHETFVAARIPALSITSGDHADLRRPTDDAERVDAPGVARVVGLALELVDRIGATSALEFALESKVPPGRVRAE